MSILKLYPENFQNYTLTAHPKRVFSSSSIGGVTGSVPLFSDASLTAKDFFLEDSEVVESVKLINSLTDAAQEIPQDPYTSTDEYARLIFAAMQIQMILPDIMAGGDPGLLTSDGILESFLKAVNELPQSKRYKKHQSIRRFVPGAKHDKTHMKKSVIKKTLFEYYKADYNSLDWSYTNYHSLNFFTSTGTPNDVALIYPASSSSFTDNFYAPSSSFTFDFYVKPTVRLDTPSTAEYNAGTILHMSSCYSLSLVSGSSRGPDGKPDKFRVLLQLSQSADINPSQCILNDSSVTSNYGDPGFLFASKDNSLDRDRWHHVSVRWPGGFTDGGVGSIQIDGSLSSNFTILSSSVMQSSQSLSGVGDPNALFVGNYYEGTNSGNQAIAKYFHSKVSREQGLRPYQDLLPNEDPYGHSLPNPLQAEIHDLKIFKSKKSDKEVASFREKGLTFLPNDLLFYLPPYFVQSTRKRNILQTPFFDATGSSEDPFNVSLSFGVAGREINLENFTREFVRSEYPRLFNLTSSREDASVVGEKLTSNDIMYASGSAVKRLYTILPCDNGNFVPNFNLLQTSSLQKQKFVDSYGSPRIDLITLDNMVSTENLPTGLAPTLFVPDKVFNDGVYNPPGAIYGDDESVSYGTGSLLFDLMGAAPEDPSAPVGSILTVLMRTRDPSSNEVVFFDVSNILYGDRILPGTMIIEDKDPYKVSGSFCLEVRDDSRGNLYRSNISNPNLAAQWASVGNVLYHEGIVIIKSPHMGFFGKNNFKMTFKGERKTYVFEVIVPLEENLFNSSSNPQFKELMPTNNSNESASSFSYVTGINLHDDNLNIVGRANLAQPVVKRESDRIVVKLRMDF